MSQLETCCSCGKAFAPVRQNHAYCSRRCKNSATVRRRRSEKPAQPREGVTGYPSTAEGVTGPAPYFNLHGATPGALQGDDYPLEYYDDGFPKLPACFDRRQHPDDETELGKAA